MEDMQVLINEIKEGQKVEFFEEKDGRRFSNKSLFPIKDAVPTFIELHTLTGLVEYIKWEAPKSCAIHVLDYNKVELISIIEGAFKQRATYAAVQYDTIALPIDDYISQENFIISLQSSFVQDETTANILQIISTLTDGTVGTYVDDGLAQKVTVSAGVSSNATAKVPNPVALRPYRTFLEVEQPLSKFVLRLKSQSDGRMPAIGLFAADGGEWRNQARMNIKKYFAEQLPDMPCIA